MMMIMMTTTTMMMMMKLTTTMMSMMINMVVMITNRLILTVFVKLLAKIEFAREEAFQLRSSTVTFSYFCFLLFVFYICLSVCRFC